MQSLRYFMDTHDAAHGTFPSDLTPEQFEGFFAKFDAACRAEGVVILRLHVAYQDNKAFCLTLAPDAAAIERAHQRVGLPFDGISEVKMASPGDTFFRHPVSN